MIETIKNRFGELVTKWSSHKHPDNHNFTQLVMYMHIQREDGKNLLHWRLQNSSANDKHLIADITLDEAKAKYADVNEQISEPTEEEYHEWLKKRNAL